MGILDFIKGELIDVIEWTDDSRDTLSFRFPDQDKAIKNGAQLIVRESQTAQFVYLGEFGDTFGPGKTPTRQVRHVRWEPASGVVHHDFDDQPVAGSHGLDHSLLQAIEPFPTQELVPYATSFLAGFVVEHYQERRQDPRPGRRGAGRAAAHRAHPVVR